MCIFRPTVTCIRAARPNLERSLAICFGRICRKCGHPQKLSESIVDGSYRFCNANACEYLRNERAHAVPLSPPALVEWARREDLLDPGSMPAVMNFGFDRSCNLGCNYCRKEIFQPNASGRALIAAIDANIFGSTFDGVERIILLGEGDPFASPFYREQLRDYDWSRYPQLRIKIQTNGLLLTPTMWKSIVRSHAAIDWISVSVDAATTETYAKNRGGDFQQLLRNLEFIANLRALGDINRFFINFLVQANNFREIPDFARLGRHLGCDLIEFQRLENWGTYTSLEYAERAVHEPIHADYNHFLQILRDPVLEDKAVWLMKLGACDPTDSLGVVSCRSTT